MDILHPFRKKKEQSITSDANDNNKHCPFGEEGCPSFQKHHANEQVALFASAQKRLEEKLEEVDSEVALAKTQIEDYLKEIDETVKLLNGQLEDKIKEVDSIVKTIQEQIKKNKMEDREYFLARTAQIGLFAIREARRIVRATTAKGKIRAIDFDAYGLDKYFGEGYNECIDDIWKIETLYHRYDKNIDDGQTPPAELITDITTYANKITDKVRDKLRDAVFETEAERTALGNVRELKDYEILTLMEKFRKRIQGTISDKIS